MHLKQCKLNLLNGDHSFLQADNHSAFNINLAFNGCSIIGEGYLGLDQSDGNGIVVETACTSGINLTSIGATVQSNAYDTLTVLKSFLT